MLGVSKDSVASHKKFAEKYGLPFPLLSDEGLEAIRAYDVWQEKNMYGKKTMGVVRTTYLIDEQGVIQQMCIRDSNLSALIPLFYHIPLLLS